MNDDESFSKLRWALCRQITANIAAMRKLGCPEQDVVDATSQARATLRSGTGTPITDLRSAALIAAIEAQVSLSELVFRKLGYSEHQIFMGISQSRSALRYKVSPAVSTIR